MNRPRGVRRASAAVARRRVRGAPRSTVWELAPGLLLVFKPRGHREGEHTHPYGQCLRVVRGRLEIRTARGVRRVAAGAPAVRIAAGRAHATRALADTWLIAERLMVAPVSSAARRRRSRAAGPRRR